MLRWNDDMRQAPRDGRVLWLRGRWRIDGKAGSDTIVLARWHERIGIPGGQWMVVGFIRPYDETAPSARQSLCMTSGSNAEFNPHEWQPTPCDPDLQGGDD